MKTNKGFRDVFEASPSTLRLQVRPVPSLIQSSWPRLHSRQTVCYEGYLYKPRNSSPALIRLTLEPYHLYLTQTLNQSTRHLQFQTSKPHQHKHKPRIPIRSTKMDNINKQSNTDTDKKPQADDKQTQPQPQPQPKSSLKPRATLEPPSSTSSSANANGSRSRQPSPCPPRGTVVTVEDNYTYLDEAGNDLGK